MSDAPILPLKPCGAIAQASLQVRFISTFYPAARPRYTAEAVKNGPLSLVQVRSVGIMSTEDVAKDRCPRFSVVIPRRGKQGRFPDEAQAMAMLSSLQARRREPEIIDQLDLDEGRHVHALRGLERI